MLENKYYRGKVLLKMFYLNGHAAGFRGPQTWNLESTTCIPESTAWNPESNTSIIWIIIRFWVTAHLPLPEATFCPK